jgi:predicted transcriptional regulator
MFLINVVLSLIPCLGSLVSLAMSLYLLYLEVIAVKVANAMSTGRAAAVIIIFAVLVAIVVFFIAAAAVLAMARHGSGGKRIGERRLFFFLFCCYYSLLNIFLIFFIRLEEGEEIHSFVLRGCGAPVNACMILFYVAAPVKELAGYAEFVERRCGGVQEVWDVFGRESVLASREAYEEFVGGARRVSFVRFKDLHVAGGPISLKTLLLSLGVKRLSRKGFYVDRETTERLISMMEWKRA